MRKTLLVVATSAAVACTAPTLEGSPISGGSVPFALDGGRPSPATSGSDPDSRSAPDGGAGAAGGGASGGPPGGSGFDGTNLPDTDGDGVPDPFDCDPQSNKLGALLLDDDLATAKGIVEAAPGFDPSAWVHGGGGYRQEQLRNAPDASFFKIAASPNVVVDVRATSTRTGNFSPTLHQDLVVVGASATNGQFSGFGCGVEFVEGSDPMGVASIVHLDGPVAAILTTPIKRQGRPFLPTNEEFAITVRVQSGVLACTVVQGQTTTTVAANVGAVEGAIGLYTHQAASMFRAVRICQT